MKRLLVIICLIVLSSSLFAQIDLFDDDDTTASECSHNSFDLGIRKSGISFGNSPVWDGLRINFSDCGVQEINGINITFWKPGRNDGSRINGISIGLAPFADVLQGIQIGLLGVVAQEKLQGINIGGLAAVSEGNMDGINFGGLAVVSQNNLRGINIGGLATVSEGNQLGFNFGGLAVVSQGNLFGFNFGGLAVVAEGQMSGINIGGLAIVGQESLKGINMAGLAIVSEGDILGINQALLAIVSQSAIKGITIAGYKIDAPEFRGLNISGWVDVEDFSGFSTAVYHKISNTQRGLVIGLFNVAEELHGVQIGLINIAKNNKGIAKVLPFINANFD